MRHLRLAVLGVALSTAWVVNATSELCAQAQDPGVEPESQELIVLLAAGRDAPSAEEVVARGQQRLALPGSLDAGNPQRIKLGITHRAQGAARERLQADPDSPEARLERYVVISYPSGTDLEAIKRTLRADPNVLHVQDNRIFSFSALPSDPFIQNNSFGIPLPPPEYQWGAYVLNLPGAWDYAVGNSYVGVLDTGLAVNHEDLRPFDGSTYAGGNFRAQFSYDFGDADADVDEIQGTNIPGAGHGTHVSGIIAATADNGMGVTGTCWHCSLMMAKIVDDNKKFLIHEQDVVDSLSWVINNGAQVVNMSLGRAADTGCADDAQLSMFCTAIEWAQRRDVTLVAASGNSRQHLQFPANDPHFIAVGGVEPVVSGGSLGTAFWDEEDEGGCPFAPAQSECGSNYTVNFDRNHQTLVAPAADVLSTFYPDKTWNATIGCQANPASPYNGKYGLCTGTSMSTPFVTGISGILRSVNPLLTKDSIKDLLTSNADHAANPDDQFGYGVPNAAESVKDALGRVGGAVLPNRLTPLFRLYSSYAEDHLSTTVPQMATAALFDATAPYEPSGPDVPGYPEYPGGACQVSPCIPTQPSASAYVFATGKAPYTGALPLVPLYRMSYVGTNPGNGNTLHRDVTLATKVADVQNLKAAGYRLDGIEGYVYGRCTPEPMCIPAGAVRLYRLYSNSRRDFAIFPESELSQFQNDGYAPRPGWDDWIGYVYPNADFDDDTLIDGFENLIGTDQSQADSDCDGAGDGSEILNYPYGDPLTSPCGTRDARVLSQTVPTTMAAGRVYSVSVTLKNVGSATWSPIGAQCGAYRLGAVNPYNNTTWTAGGRVELTATVPSGGGQTTLTFDVTAPTTPGVYNFQWRMLQECVTWFGYFTPNVVVTVMAAPPRDAQIRSQSVPPIMVAGESYAVSVRVRNVGTLTWSPIGPACNAYRLGSANPYGNNLWGLTRVELPMALAPGQEATLNFTVTAPSTPGSYHFQWRMVQECVAWFGDFTPDVLVNVQAIQRDADFISQSVPTSMNAGGTYPVSVTFKNAGNNAWSPIGPVCGAYRLGSANPYNNGTWVPATRVELPAPVAANGQVTFSFNVTAPATPGTYNFQWQMVQECMMWFGDFAPNVAVSVN